MEYAGNFTTGTVSVTASNGVGASAATTLAITKTAPAVPATLVMTSGNSITPVLAVGPFMATATEFTLTAAPVAGAVAYDWILPAGVNKVSGGTSNVITVNFNDVQTPTGITPLIIGVKAVNGCDLSSATAKTLSLTRILPVKPAVIATTRANVCSVAGSAATVTYSVAPVAGAFANGYNWEVTPGANIVSGQGSNAIVVEYAGDFSVGTLSVTASNGVGVSPATTLAIARVSGIAAPATLVGQVTGICTGSTYNYSFAAGANAQTYVITGPALSVIKSADNPNNTTNSITTSNLAFTVQYTSALSATSSISIVASNPCGTAAAKLFTVANTVGAITTLTGTTAVNACDTYTYVASPVVGATSYVWTLPANALVSGSSSTNTIVVTFPGTLPALSSVKVAARNACGASSAVKLLALTSTACPLAITLATEVTNNVTDNPCDQAGATVSSMEAIASLTGTVAVNTCDTYTYEATPVIGATSYVWTLPANAVITEGLGTTKVVVSFPETLHAEAAVNVAAKNACGITSAIKSLTLNNVTCPQAKNFTTFNVNAYPNPSTESFNFNLTTASEDKVSVVVYDVLGNLIDNREVNPSEVAVLQLGSTYPAGIYNVFVTQGANIKTLRVIKN